MTQSSAVKFIIIHMTLYVYDHSNCSAHNDGSSKDDRNNDNRFIDNRNSSNNSNSNNNND
jgi:hypothetical protein